MNKVVIIVYDRVENIKLWLNCWEQCEHHDFELVVIHNYNGSEAIKKLCDAHSIKYIRRENKGFDIGAFKDICNGLFEWDKILWIADDTIPMSKDFIKPFLDQLTLAAGVVCTDLSPYVKTHIRTTGFMIRREVTLR